MHRWIGRVALVTGASDGIGAAISRELVKQGMIVVGCARNAQKIEEIAKKVVAPNSQGKLHALRCDMSRESEILGMHEEIRSRFGRIDECINNAIACFQSSLLTGKTSDWRYMMEVGILGMCINTRETVKLMREKNIDGHIINMGSMCGHELPHYQKPTDEKPYNWFHIYYGMKHMRRALTKGLHQELRAADSRILVSLISPDAVYTDLLRKALPDEDYYFEGFNRRVKLLDPEDVAGVMTSILQSPPHVNIHDVILESLEFQL